MCADQTVFAKSEEEKYLVSVHQKQLEYLRHAKFPKNPNVKTVLNVRMIKLVKVANVSVRVHGLVVLQLIV